MNGLTLKDIMKVVYTYIGVSQTGYLGDFTFRTHKDFYPTRCDLDIDPSQIAGTTRERFIQILSSASPHDQAKILKGVLRKYPARSAAHRTPELYYEICQMIFVLENGPESNAPDTAVTIEDVRRMIAHAETRIQIDGETSEVERIPPLLHRYVLSVCEAQALPTRANASTAELLMALKKHHPALQNLGVQDHEITRIFQAFSSVMDAFEPAHGHGSMEAAGNQPIPKEEALLILHASKTLVDYLEKKLS